MIGIRVEKPSSEVPCSGDIQPQAMLSYTVATVSEENTNST